MRVTLTGWSELLAHVCPCVGSLRRVTAALAERCRREAACVERLVRRLRFAGCRGGQADHVAAAAGAREVVVRSGCGTVAVRFDAAEC
jgi:hypothetical protein